MIEAVEFSATETLPGGLHVEIRPLFAHDREALMAAVRNMTDTSLQRRFFALKREFSAKEKAYFLNVDQRTHVALVAVASIPEPAIVGGARYVALGRGRAELACAVVDQFQHRGLGTLLVRRLCEIAHQAGLQELVAEVLVDNIEMLRILRKLACPTHVQRHRDSQRIVIEIAQRYAKQLPVVQTPDLWQAK
jgi:RimJ/RimL family protein N-acetyltransferase